MGISHELSGDIAAALFSGQERSPRELSELKDVILEIHSTLEQLNREADAANEARRVRPDARLKAKAM